MAKYYDQLLAKTRDAQATQALNHKSLNLNWQIAIANPRLRATFRGS